MAASTAGRSVKSAVFKKLDDVELTTVHAAQFTRTNQSDYFSSNQSDAPVKIQKFSSFFIPNLLFPLMQFQNESRVS